jgi:hypothetical protein
LKPKKYEEINFSDNGLSIIINFIAGTDQYGSAKLSGKKY